MKRTDGAAPQGRFLELKCDRRGIHALVSLFASMPLPSAVLCWRVASAGEAQVIEKESFMLM